MAVSRRKFVTSVAAGSALAAVSATELVTALATPAAAASPPGDVVGKITVGYQGWFACIGDGSPINGWWHWSNNWGQPPSPSNNAIVSWPDMRDYTRGYQSAYANLGNGQPATLFSQYDDQTVDTHFRWMQENGCDTAALQRFNPFSSEGPIRDAVTAKVRTAAEARGRKFYIMYDVTDWLNFQTEIKTDWTTKMSAYTASSAYARQNGKPVVCIWGFGFSEPSRPFTPPPCLEVINWFKAQGCYVIGGVPTWWRLGINDSRPGFFDVYTAFNMISPWMVGRAGSPEDLDSYYNNVNVGDMAECTARGIDYQPCVMPGNLAARGTRRHGDFYWRHIYNMVRLGSQGLYVSMFDEYNEGNQIAKTAESAAWVPANSNIVPLDEDGTACSADYYLRITADGGKMLKGLIPLTAIRPTQPIVGGQPPVDSNLARGKATSASTSNGGFASGNAVDGNAGSYWESVNNAFPQWLQVDLGAPATISRVVLKLPSGWGTRTQTLSIQGSTNGSTFTTIAASQGRVFDPAAANTVTITFPAASARYVRVNVTANTGWPAAQCSEFEVYGTTGNPPTDTQPPTAPGNLTVTGKTSNSVSLSWQASTDNVGVTGYQVRQGSAVVATVTGTTHTVTGLTPSTAYSFTVTAQDAAGNTSAPSNTATTTTNPPTDAQPPTAPANLTVTGKTTNSVSLSWQASTDNVGVTGYQVRQGSTVVATVTGTTHTVTGLNPNTSYSFTVTARDAAGNTSAASNTATTTTNPAPNTNLAQGKPATASSTTQNYVPGNTVDGNSSSYWESANNAFPQWLQVDLGAATAISRIVLKLPPPSAWGTRTQTLSVQGSTNGSTFTTVAGSAGYTFNPATGNTVTITFPSTSQRYVRLNFTANTGWPAGQISEFEIYAS